MWWNPVVITVGWRFKSARWKHFDLIETSKRNYILEGKYYKDEKNNDYSSFSVFRYCFLR